MELGGSFLSLERFVYRSYGIPRQKGFSFSNSKRYKTSGQFRQLAEAVEAKKASQSTTNPGGGNGADYAFRQAP